MGAFCSKISVVDRSPSEITLHNGVGEHYVAFEAPSKGQGNYKTVPLKEPVEKQLYEEQFLYNEGFAGEPKILRSSSPKLKSSASKAASAGKNGAKKSMEVSSLLGRASTAGFGKAVEVLDTLGSSMTSLNTSSGFGSGITTKGNKISILAFEVANTVVKGANLMQSLSKENVKHLKEMVLQSEGVQRLVSKDIGELLRIAAADKREELKVFSGEVVRFGNRCKDPQWHQLDRYFIKLESDFSPQEHLKETAPEVMQHLMSLVGHTAELYHELHALDRFHQDYKRKLQEEESALPAQRGENLQILRQELKSQRRHVKSLKKKSLWSKILEEVTANLVDIVHFLHLEIHEAFGVSDGVEPSQEFSKRQRLGPAGLALHYANLVTQIDTVVSRSSSVPPNMRDSLYQGLPLSIKSALRSKLQSFQIKEELTVSQIKAEMEKTLQWLVPVANNTTRAHHGFGWVGEWANTGTEYRKSPGQIDVVKLETLYHADKEKADTCILDLVLWLHHLISQHRPGSAGVRSPVKSPVRSPVKSKLTASLPANKGNISPSKLSKEDAEMLQAITSRKLTPHISKSQEFYTGRPRLSKHERLSRSTHQSPTADNVKGFTLTREPNNNFDVDRIKVLDIIDRVDNVKAP